MKKTIMMMMMIGIRQQGDEEDTRDIQQYHNELAGTIVHFATFDYDRSTPND